MINFPNNPKVGDAFTHTGTIYTCVQITPIVWNAAPSAAGIADAPTDGLTYGRNNALWKALDKTDVGLSNVNNTSDANKPISTATQTALNTKEPNIALGTTAQYWRGDKTWQALGPAAVGLPNVANARQVYELRNGASAIYIGWNGNVELQIDSTYFGTTWPMHISGNAASANNATTANGQRFDWSNAGNAPTYFWCADNNGVAYLAYRPAVTVGNANQVSGIGGWSYSNWANNPAYLWATEGDGQAQHLTQPGNLSVNYANSCNYANSAGSAPANGGTSTNSNQLCGQGCGYWVNNAGTAAQNLKNNGSIQLICDIGGAGDRWWAVNISDERVKRNIVPSKVDSLAEINQIKFIQYNFRDDVPWVESTAHDHLDGVLVPKEHPATMAIDDGRLHQIGVSAQQLLTINPELVETEIGQWYQPYTDKLLYRALMAIQQLSAEVTELRALVKPV